MGGFAQSCCLMFETRHATPPRPSTEPRSRKSGKCHFRDQENGLWGGPSWTHLNNPWGYLTPPPLTRFTKGGENINIPRRWLKWVQVGAPQESTFWSQKWHFLDFLCRGSVEGRGGAHLCTKEDSALPYISPTRKLPYISWLWFGLHPQIQIKEGTNTSTWQTAMIRDSEKGALEKGYLHKIVRNWLSNSRQICDNFAQPFPDARNEIPAILQKFGAQSAQRPLRERPLFGISEMSWGPSFFCRSFRPARCVLAVRWCTYISFVFRSGWSSGLEHTRSSIHHASGISVCSIHVVGRFLSLFCWSLKTCIGLLCFNSFDTSTCVGLVVGCQAATHVTSMQAQWMNL